MRCQASKRDGTPCTLPARSGNGTCWAHDPAKAEQRRRAASKAGKTKPSAELHQIKRRLRNIADEVLEGKITTAKGSVAAQVLGVYLRAVEQERKNIETQELADRLEQLEAAYEEVPSVGDEESHSKVGAPASRPPSSIYRRRAYGRPR